MLRVQLRQCTTRAPLPGWHPRPMRPGPRLVGKLLHPWSPEKSLPGSCRSSPPARSSPSVDRVRVEHRRPHRGAIGPVEQTGQVRQCGVTEVLPVGPGRLVDAHNTFHRSGKRRTGRSYRCALADHSPSSLGMSTPPSTVEDLTSKTHGPVAPPYVAILYSVATRESCNSRIRRRTVSRCAMSMSSRSGTVCSPSSTNST